MQRYFIQISGDDGRFFPFLIVRLLQLHRSLLTSAYPNSRCGCALSRSSKNGCGPLIPVPCLWSSKEHHTHTHKRERERDRQTDRQTHPWAERWCDIFLVRPCSLGTRVQFIPSTDKGPRQEMDYLRWKDMLATVVNMHVLQEKRWFLRHVMTTLPPPSHAHAHAERTRPCTHTHRARAHTHVHTYTRTNTHTHTHTCTHTPHLCTHTHTRTRMM